MPNASDWSWIPSAPNMTDVPYGSQLMIGDYNNTEWLNTDFPTPLDVTAANPNNWTFTLSQFAFGYTNTTDAENPTSSYVNLTTDNYHDAFMTLGHPGIALPSPMFDPFV